MGRPVGAIEEWYVDPEAELVLGLGLIQIVGGGGLEMDVAVPAGGPDIGLHEEGRAEAGSGCLV